MALQEQVAARIARLGADVDELTPAAGDVIVGTSTGTIGANLVDAIAGQIALDGMVVAAAEAAIDAAILGHDILDGGDIDTTLNDPIFAVVDNDGRRTWVEIAPDGGLTTRTTETLVTVLAPDLSASVQADIGLGDIDTTLNDPIFAVVDNDGRRTWLECAADGGPTVRSVELLNAAILDGVTASTVLDADGVAVTIDSGPSILCSGDSLTASDGGGGTTYPGVLATLTGRTVVNLGMGGEGSASIAARVGGRPYLATVSGGQIPTSGGVTITLAFDTTPTVPAGPLNGSFAFGVNPCTIAGVAGNIARVGADYVFTRSESGTAVDVPRQTIVIPFARSAYRNHIHVMWWGSNDFATIGAAVIARQRATIEEMTALRKRWLVIGVSVGTTASRATNDAELVAEYGMRFLNPRLYLSSTTALAEAGITPTAQDMIDIAAGTVPDSLRVDGTHLNAAGYTLIAEMVYARMVELGWL